MDQLREWLKRAQCRGSHYSNAKHETCNKRYIRMHTYYFFFFFDKEKTYSFGCLLVREIEKRNTLVNSYILVLKSFFFFFF